MSTPHLARYPRMMEFPDQIRELGQTNPVINTIITQYTYGYIITKEEALCQMIVALAKDWDAEKRRVFEMLQQVSPIFTDVKP